jgi:hypothetical protein
MIDMKKIAAECILFKCPVGHERVAFLLDKVQWSLVIFHLTEGGFQTTTPRLMFLFTTEL